MMSYLTRTAKTRAQQAGDLTLSDADIELIANVIDGALDVKLEPIISTLDTIQRGLRMASGAEDAPRPKDEPSGKYGPLERSFAALPANRKTRTLGFSSIERILQDELPPSARKHREWWSNTSMHPEARSWLRPGMARCEREPR